MPIRGSGSSGREGPCAFDSALVPLPREVLRRPGGLTINRRLGIRASEENAATVRRLLTPGTDLSLLPSPDGRLRVCADPRLPREGYSLTVTETGIEIRSRDLAGTNWAVQTLRQLMPPSACGPAPLGSRLVVPAVQIQDAPRFSWRGVMLDVARHFMPIWDVLRMVDVLALHKFNVLQLHLTDDQGWRLDIQRYPELARRGATRSETRPLFSPAGDGTPHGGHYTQDQIRALVEYAAQRGITVVPEIDLPSHVGAFLAAFPQFAACPTDRRVVQTDFSPHADLLDLSDACLEVLDHILEEVLDLFPSLYIHLGGDECALEQWAKSSTVAVAAGERGITDLHEYQRWFTLRMRDWLSDRGRVLIGWDEIAETGPVDHAMTVAWRRPAYAAKAARSGMDVIVAPQASTYFDYYAGASDAEPLAVGGLTTVRDVYRFDPLAEVAEIDRRHVVGTQCQLWTECIPTMRQAHYMLFPRACAHAEVAWTDPDRRDLDDFERRLSGHLLRLDAMGVEYRPEAGPHPWQQGGTGLHRKPAEHRGGGGPPNPFETAMRRIAQA